MVEYWVWQFRIWMIRFFPFFQYSIIPIPRVALVKTLMSAKISQFIEIPRH